MAWHTMAQRLVLRYRPAVATAEAATGPAPWVARHTRRSTFKLCRQALHSLFCPLWAADERTPTSLADKDRIRVVVYVLKQER